MEERLTILENLVNQLVSAVNSLENFGTLSPEVERSIRRRLFSLGTTTPGAHADDVSLGGSRANVMTGFITVIDADGIPRNVPYY